MTQAGYAGSEHGTYGAPQAGPYVQQSPQPGYGPASGQYGGAAGSTSFGVIGASIVAVGAILLVTSFTVLNWFSKNGGSDGGANGKSAFGKLHGGIDKVVSRGQGLVHAAPVANAYFSWLGWVLLVAAVLTALTAQLPSSLSSRFRQIGLVVGLVSAGVTLWAIKLLSVNDGRLDALVKSGALPSSDRAQIRPVGTYGFYLDHIAIGFWFAVAGFLTVGVGAAVGARRRT